MFLLHALDEQGRCTCGEGCKHHGKHPISVPAHSWTSDLALLEAWRQWWPNANIATPVGRRFGLFVYRHRPCGLSSLRRLQIGRGPVPEPVAKARSGRSGLHYYYPYEERAPSGILAPGVMFLGDFPGDKHLFVPLPPITTYGRYEWL